MTGDLSAFVGPSRGWASRIGVLVGAYAIFFASMYRLTPWVQGRLFGWAEGLAPGPRLLVGHTLSWQLAHTLVTVAMLLALLKTGIFKPPAKPDWAAGIRWGLGVGLGCSAVTALLYAFAGPGFGFDLNFWKIGGNVVSNFYEELNYRVLLFGAGLYCFRRFLPAAALSGLAFGLTHTQFPMVFRLFTAGVGILAALAYFRSRTIFAAWLAHQLSDMLLDTFLK
jgi:hypothetical protein